MTVPPLPFSRSPRDHDALAGQGGQVGASRAPVTRIGVGASGNAQETVSDTTSGRPAMLVDDGRGALTVLNEARTQAEQIGTDLEQLTAASGGVSRVAKLLERLRDVTVAAVSRDLEPAQRAALQRQVDQTLDEIDTVAGDTLIEDRLLRGTVRPISQDAAAPKRAPFRAIGSSALGLADLAVRSTDQAFAAASAVDLASSRLQRTAETVSRATARLEHDLAGLTSPPVTASGELSIGNSTAAFRSTILLRSDLLASPGEAMRAQSDLEVSRVVRLLDSSVT